MFTFLGFAQEFKNEEDRKKHADKLFDKGQYTEASPHILHFLSLNQTSPEYNFKYGVCLMYTDQDKEKSLRYLKFSAAKDGGGDSRVYFFLGKSYHLNYNFKAALVNYNKFKAKGAENYKKDLQVDLHIAMCTNGEKLLQNLTELVVYEKTESSFERFQYSYDLKEIGGKILVSSEFQSKYDKKVDYKSVVYFPPLNQDVLFYSSYGKDGSTGLDLYMVRRDASGGWGSPEKLPDNINTPYDDAYGFLHADGETFYFSSKGHNSMGGYDVFKVNYDAQVNRFGTPKNLDYKINTPDDDIMYIVDPKFENAYFSSSRAAKSGYLDVYKVKVETFPIVNVILAGSFKNKINPKDYAATIKVENMKTGEIEGIYNPDKQGDYIIVLPRSGKYKFIVETPESSKIHSGIVEVPAQKKVKPLKQTLELVMDNGSEKLVINNLFDQEVANAAEIMAQVLKSMANPEPNADDFPDSLFQDIEKDNNLVTEALDENYSVDDLVAMSADKANEVQEEANEIKKRMEAAFTVANAKSMQAKTLSQQADDILSEVETITNPLEKQEKIALAQKAHGQSKDLNMLATTALNLANNLKKEYDKKQAEADDAKSVAQAIKKAINENSHEKAIAALKELQGRIDALIDDQPNYKSGFDEIVERASLKQQEADKATVNAQQYRDADTELSTRLSNLKKELERAKPKDQGAIQRQIDDIKEQLVLNDALAKESFTKSAALQKEADVLNHQVDLMGRLFDDIEAGTTVALTDAEKQKVKDYLASNELSETISENEEHLSQHVSTEENTAEGSTASANTLSTTEKKDVVTTLKKEFSDYESKVNALPKTNSTEALITKKELTENWLEALAEKEASVTKQLANTTDTKQKLALSEQLTWLAAEQEAKTTSLSSLDEQLAVATTTDSNQTVANTANFTNSTNEATLSAAEKQAIIASTEENYDVFEKELKAVNPNASSEEKAAAKKKITQEWIETLGEDIMDLEDQLALETDSKSIANKAAQLNWLKEKKAEKTSALEAMDNQLATTTSNETTSTTNATTLLSNAEKSNIIAEQEEKYTSFEERLNAVDASGNDLASLKQKTIIAEEWINSINSESKTIEKQLVNTTDAKEQAALTAQLDWLAEEKESRKVELVGYTTEIARLETGTVVYDENQLVTENQKAENWLAIIDQDINELNEKIKVETDPSKKTALIESKEKLVQLKNEKQNIVATNSTIIENTTEQKAIENTPAYKTLASTVENSTVQPVDVERSFTANLRYESKEAQDLQTKSTAKVEELVVVEQQVASLELDLEATTKEKKKAAIENQLESANKQKVSLEIAVGETIVKTNEAEFKANETKLNSLVSTLEINNKTLINDENFQTAKLLEEKYTEQNKAANLLVNEANSIDNEEQKAEKLKTAHTTQQAAISNQQEAINMLEKIQKPDYQPVLISAPETLLATENQSKDQPTSSTYIPKQQSVFADLASNYETSPTTEKETALANWKAKVDGEVANNMKLLTSSIPDSEKQVINSNLIWLRTQQELVNTKIEENSLLAANNQQPTTNSTPETNNAPETNNTVEENLANNTEEGNTSTANTTVENNASNSSKGTTLKTQKEVFNSFENKVTAATSSQEEAAVYKEWITKIDAEIATNKTAITGNITVAEEADIETNLAWLAEQKIAKQQLLASIEQSENTLAANRQNSTNTTENSTVPKTIKEQSNVTETVEGIEFNSANKTLETYAVSTVVENKELTQQLEFKSTAANELMVENAPTITKIKEYEVVIDRLETQQSDVDDDKLKASIDKKIEKTTVKKEKTALKLADDFKTATAQDNELADQKLNEVKAAITKNTDQTDFEYKQAQEFEEKAEQLANEAKQLRNEAAGIKSVVEKNAKINEALSKEKTSIVYKEKASKLYADAIVNSYLVDDSQLATIAEEADDRASSQLKTAAKTADKLAYEYSTRAGELRDSASTVKKKEQSKIIQEAEVYTQRSEVQATLAKALQKEGDRVAAKEAVVVENNLLVANLTPSAAEKVRASENYAAIYDQQLVIDKLEAAAKTEEELVKSYDNLIQQQENAALAYQEKAKSATTEEERKELTQVSEKLIEKAKENKVKKEEATAIVNTIYTKKKQAEQEQSELLALADENLQQDIKAVLISTLDKAPVAPKVVVPAPERTLASLTSSTFEAPEQLTTNIVVMNNNARESVYSESNPIPMNPKNPTGLVYKVQVGAFRNPIPQDLFKGFAPISAEKISDDITRYRVGYFVNFETANSSKNEIRTMGYPDAFVVAVLNGKRISIDQARAYTQNPENSILANNEITTPAQNNTVANNATENVNTASNTQQITTPSTPPATNQVADNTTTTTVGINTNVNTNSTATEVPEYVQNLGEEAAEVSAVESIKGLFFTVQVGAFSSPIAKTGVFNISPLITKQVNGLYKYTTGVYKSVAEADGRKNEVRAKGIPDAFVIAYNNGEQITIAKANQLIEEQGNSVFAVLPTPNRGMVVIEEEEENTNTYYVDLGVFKKSVPTVIAEALLNYKTFKIKQNKVKDVGTQYYCGVFLKRAEAEAVLKTFVDGGVVKAKIIELEADETELIEESEKNATNQVHNNVMETKLVYRVELGSYTGTIPAVIGKVFIELSYLGIENKGTNGKQTYYCGKVNSEAEANELKQKFIDKGIVDAKVVAFVGHRQISLTEAAELAK